MKKDDKRYVAFLDLLGFSNRVLGNFEEARDAYRQTMSMVTKEPAIDAPVSIRIVSDSVVIVSEELAAVVLKTQQILMGTLFENSVVRGAIAFGPHWEETRDDDLLVVSQPLVEAARLERQTKYPRVVLSPAIEPPEAAWRGYGSTFLQPLLYYQDLWIVNPFGIWWGESAATRMHILRSEHPEYAEKYDWFLELYEAVRRGDQLVPTEGGS